MKKKGFTLIELLAVIVILAIIALIATPIVMNTIENAKKGAAERSADNYIDAVETEVAKQRIDGVVLEGEYTIQSDGSLCEGSNVTNCEKPIKIDMSGNKPNGGTIIIENGKVADKLSADESKKTTMTVDDYTVSYDAEGKQLVASKEESGANTTTIVYRWSTDSIKIGDAIDPTDTTKYKSNPSTIGKAYYLKHVLNENNEVTESYACAVFGDTETCLRGGSTDYFAENELFLTGLHDKGVECRFGEFELSYCFAGPIFLAARTTGYVSSDSEEDAVTCDVKADGNSYCTSY